MTFDDEGLLSQGALQLPIEVQPLGGDLVVVAVHGDIDLKGAGELRAVLNDACVGPHHTVQLDLAGTHFIGSSGMGVLVAVSQRMVGEERRFEVLNVAPAIRAAFEIAGVAHVLDG